MKASFVEKLVVKFLAFYNWWGIWVVPDVVIHSTQSNSSISCNNSIHKVNLQQPSNVILMQCASQKTVLGNSPLFVYSLKTKDRQFDNVVVTGGTISCHNDNLWCHQWRQSCQIDDLLFSVFLWLPIANITLAHKLLEIHGWAISTAAVEALVILYNQSFNSRSADHSHPCISSCYSAEYVSSYASKQLQNWYHCEQNKISKIRIKSK